MINFWQIRLVAFILCLVSFSAQAEINIAMVVPSSQNGNELTEGAMIAVDEINRNGGVHGQRLNLIRIEDPCDDVLSMTTAEMISLNKISSERMELVIGPYCANRGGEIADLYRQKKVFQMLPVPASAETYKEQQALPLRFLGYAEEQANALYGFYGQHFGEKPLALVYDNASPESMGVAKSLLQKFEDNGTAEHLQLYSLENYAGNFNKMAKNIVAGENGAVYLAVDSDKMLEIARLIRERNADLPIITNRFQTAANFVKHLGSAAKNTYLLKLSSLKDNPYFAEALVQLRLAGNEPEELMPYGYLAIRFAENLWNADGFSFEKIKQEVKNSRFETGWGSNGLANGAPRQAPKYVLEKYVNGEYTQVY